MIVRQRFYHKELRAMHVGGDPALRRSGIGACVLAQGAPIPLCCSVGSTATIPK
jgi:hypothetical protein